MWDRFLLGTFSEWCTGIISRITGPSNVLTLGRGSTSTKVEDSGSFPFTSPKVKIGLYTISDQCRDVILGGRSTVRPQREDGER